VINSWIAHPENETGERFMDVFKNLKVPALYMDAVSRPVAHACVETDEPGFFDIQSSLPVCIEDFPHRHVVHGMKILKDKTLPRLEGISHVYPPVFD
jgi:hypothetical protein